MAPRVAAALAPDAARLLPGLPVSDVLRADLRSVVADPAVDWDALRGSTVLVTGATGLIGSNLVRALAFADADRDLGLHVVAQGRNSFTGLSLVQACRALGCGAEFVEGDLRDPAVLAAASDPDFVVHGAGITASAELVARPADVIATTVEGTRNALDRARRSACRSFVYLSSMEVYGQGLAGEVTEAELGTLDLTNPRSAYPESKRRGEALCLAATQQHGMATTIARPGLTFGAGVPLATAGNRAPIQFARSVLAGRDVVLHTTGTSITTCCYPADLTRGLLTLLTRGTPGTAYNIANPATAMTIRAMAEIVARDVARGRIEVVVDLPADATALGYAPPSGFRLNVDRLTALGWQPTFGMADMYRRMLADWRQAAP
jgi:UDP-glucuronate decarboxylase